MISDIRHFSFFWIFLSCWQLMQGQAKTSQSTYEKKSATIELYGQQSYPIGDNYLGKGASIGQGFGARVQLFVYDNIYAGGSLTQDYHDIDNTRLTGLYDRYTRLNAYLYVGYEYSLARKWNLAADLGIGYTQNKNKQSENQGNAQFKDTGTIYTLSTLVEYELNSWLGVILRPNFEFITTNIESSQRQGSLYDNVSYFNIAVGLRFNFRSS